MKNRTLVIYISIIIILAFIWSAQFPGKCNNLVENTWKKIIVSKNVSEEQCRR
jgi:uncharacterized membrane protein (DUF106 family)